MSLPFREDPGDVGHDPTDLAQLEGDLTLDDPTQVAPRGAAQLNALTACLGAKTTRFLPRPHAQGQFVG